MERVKKTKTSKERVIQRLYTAILYFILIIVALYFLVPLIVMLFNSVKSLDEIRQGNLIAFPKIFTLDPWRKAWSYAQVGVQATGLRPYFMNSLQMTFPAVLISVFIGALNGYVLTQWRFKGDNVFFALLLFGCFIPFQIVLIPMARTLGILNMAGTVSGLVLVHVIYGIGFTTLFFRNSYLSLPKSIIQAAKVDGAGFFTIFFFVVLPLSLPIFTVSFVWQFTNIWNDFLFGVSFGGVRSQPMTVALNNLVNSSTGVKEYNVDFAGAVIAALPTLIVYIISGKFFVRGLVAGAVKG